MSMASSTAVTSAADAPSTAHRARGRTRTFWRDTARRFRSHVPAMIGLVLVVIFLIACVVGQFGTPANTNRNSLSNRLQPPSAAHPFGTDHFGREVFWRV